MRAIHKVGRLSAGLIHDWTLAKGVKLGLGAQGSLYAIPHPLEASYGDPMGGMVFVRLKIG